MLTNYATDRCDNRQKQYNRQPEETYCLADGRSSDAERRAGVTLSLELQVLP